MKKKQILNKRVLSNENSEYFHNYQDVEHKLLRDKTIIKTRTTEDYLIEDLCCPIPNSEDFLNYDRQVKAIQKFVKELFIQIKVNAFHLSFEEFKIRSSYSSFVLNMNDPIDIIMAMKKPLAVKLRNLTEEYLILDLPNEDKSRSEPFDVYEHVRYLIEGKSTLSSVKYQECCGRILKESLFNTLDSLKGIVNLIDSYNDKDNCTVLSLEFSESYLQNQDGDLPLNLKGNSISTKFRFIPGIAFNSKLKQYLICLKQQNTMPEELFIHADSEIFNHVWFQDTWWKEFMLLDRICSADNYSRIRGLNGVCKILTNQNYPTAFLNKVHYIHCLIGLISQQVENPNLSWQRMTLSDNFQEILKHIKKQLEINKLNNYFVNNSNLFDKSIESIQFQNAANFIGIMLNSKSTFISLVKEIDKFEN